MTPHNDSSSSQAMRGGRRHDRVRQIRVGAAVMIRPSEGGPEILLAQRPPGEALAGFWEFPGGKLEPGETALHAVVREVREELGVDVVPSHLIGVYDNRLIGAPKADVPVVATYACRIVSGEPAVSPEVLDFGWFTPDGVEPLTIFHAHPTKIAAAFADRVRVIGRSLSVT